MSNDDFATDMVGRRALSKEGHAAISMRGGDDRWIQIQKNTFTNWVNEQLRERNTFVEDLQFDFTDGTKLCYLVESLQGKRIKGKVVENPQNQHQMLHNAGMALTAISDDNVKLVNIGPEDIVNGNLKLILGLIWHLILRYQIGKTKFPPKKLMLAWLQAVIPECQVGNFTRDWNDGVALHALLDYCKPGLAPNWRQLNRNNKVENCRNAMELAKQHFDIPLVLRPEDLSSPDLDELSGMTYLSYYMKYDSPGYKATLNWVRNAIPDGDVNNFTTDWNDGKALCKLVRKMGGSCSANPQGSPIENLQSGIDAGKRLGVDPILSAKELSEADEEHLGIMAYAASFNHLKPGKPPSEKVALTGDFKNVVVGNEKSFGLKIQDEKVNPREIRAELEGPNSKVPVRLDWKGRSVDGHFRPKEAGPHRLVVYCQDEVISNCPVTFPVNADPNRVVVHKADRACLGVPTELKVDTSSAGQGDVTVEAISPSGRRYDLPLSAKNGMFHSAFTPSEPGDWKINVTYAGQHVHGSPYTVNVYDPNAVKVYGLEGGSVGKAFNFTADCSHAGEGDLTVNVTHNGMNVPATVSDNGYGIYKVDFVPQGAGLYQVQVMFNDNEVKGSPYTLEIVDSNLVTASGEGLSLVPVNKVATFNVDTKAAGGGDVTVDVVAPSGKYLPVRLVHNEDKSYTAEYTPEEIGDHNVEVLYRGQPVKGNPFQVKVYDAGKVIVHKMPKTVAIGHPVNFEIDASAAGSGNLEIMVNGGRIPCQVENKGKRRFLASFVPETAGDHVVEMKFNQSQLAGSPWKVDVVDPRKVSVVNNSTASLKNVPMHKTVSFYIETDGIPAQELDVVVKAPSGRSVSSRLYPEKTGYRVEYTPTEVGTYTVQIFFAGSPVAGTPFTVKSYDSTSIQVSQVPNGIVGKSVDFFIDVTKAGEGQLEIMVNNGNLPNTVTHQRPGVYKVSFTPEEAGNHYVDILFNGDRLPGAPYVCHVIDTSRVNVAVTRLVPVRESSHFVIQSQSVSGFDTTDLACVVEIIAPNGDQIPARIIPQSDGDYRVEWTPTIPGRYTIEVSFGGRQIQGSPFYVDVFDISRIRVENMQYGNVGDVASFDVDYSMAGKAEHTVRVVGPMGQQIPAEIQERQNGQHVRFEPYEPGTYKVYITYGGMEVPGSPFLIDVDEGRMPTARGDGLVKGEKDCPTAFVVDARGLRGELGVQVEGPHSIAKCNIDPERDGIYKVTYVPVEVGKYRAIVKWNGKEIPGSPFRPIVLDPRKVSVVGGWQQYMDKNNRVQLNVDEEKRIPFDVAEAGPGLLRAEVKGPRGNIPCYVEERDHKRTVCFTPKDEGDHSIYCYWSDYTLVNAPFHGYAVNKRRSPDPTKVVLSGRGLKEATVHREAEFQIDGSEAGPGRPDVRLVGVKRDIPVRVSSLGNGRYRCLYTPETNGAYLLHIHWNDRQLRGSPFKVHVVGAHYPQKVVVTGEGLKGGVMGRDINVIIDTRKAGPGELTAHCMGPHMVAYCELEDMRDGTYKLNIRPQEPGRHILQIKYGGEHVLGSPYVLRVGAQPDASKVRVSGPGVEHGVLASFQSRFIVETKGAGAGQLTVRIRGPKGAFQVEMLRDSQKDRTIMCRFDPSETGLYQIFVKWSGVDVPGSPFNVYIVDTEADLRHVNQGQIPPQFQPSTLNRSVYNSEYSTWRDDEYRM